MRMRAKSSTRRHTILIDHAQGPKPHEARIVVIGKTEAVIRIQPTMMGVTTLSGTSNVKRRDHRNSKETFSETHHSPMQSVADYDNTFFS
jgi:hypothetical protein